MTATTVNGSGNGARSGAQTFALLGRPVNVLILRALADSPKCQAELRRAADMPAQTTLRAQLKWLSEVGAIDKQRRDGFPCALEYKLTAAGRDLLPVIDSIQHWLDDAPEGGVRLDSNVGKAAIKSLAESWSAAILRALAASPLSLTELDGLIASLSYPSLERRLAAMRLAGLIESRSGNGRRTPYGVTEWLRRGVGPLVAAARWERHHRPLDTPPLAAIDIETTFLLGVPLLQPPSDVSGTCKLVAEISNGGGPRLAGAVVELREGSIAFCSTRLPSTADAWVFGPSAAWLDAIAEADVDRLELGGDCNLSHALLEGLHKRLFAGPRIRP